MHTQYIISMKRQSKEKDTEIHTNQHTQENTALSRMLVDQKSRIKLNLTSCQKSAQQLEHLFFLLQQDSITISMRLQWNRMPSILTLLSKSHFSALKTLNLGSNNISSLEPIIALRAQNLEETFLWNNKITDLRSLRKANFPKLRLIDLSRNMVISLGGLMWINADYNHVACLSEIIKIRNFTTNGRLLATENQVVSAFGVLARRGRVEATNYAFNGMLSRLVMFH